MPWTTYNPKISMPTAYNQLSEWGIDIPTTDACAYTHYPKFQWVYDKIKVCKSQNLPCGPIGTTPTSFPVIIKPIINLLGGGNRIQIAHTLEQYEYIQDGGLFWSPFQLGEHYSVDLIVLDGTVQHSIWFRGEKLSLGIFDYWELSLDYSAELECYVTDWVESNLSDYTGCVNLELINNSIIEVHLRMGDIDRIGSQPLMEAIHVLYNSQVWPNIDLEIPDTFYIAALFAQPNTRFNINKTLSNELFRDLTYYQFDKQELSANNPPSGSRLAIFCDNSLEKVTRARNIAISLFTPDIDGRYTDCLLNYKDLRI